MVQLQVDSASSNDQQQGDFSGQYHPSINTQELEENKRVNNSDSKSCTATQLSIIAWRSMLERSTNKTQKYHNFHLVRKSNKNHIRCADI